LPSGRSLTFQGKGSIDSWWEGSYFEQFCPETGTIGAVADGRDGLPVKRSLAVYSVIECGGFQFRVSEGDVITVPRMEAAKDSEVKIDKVLLMGDGAKTTVGAPVIAGASVTAKVVDHTKGPKIRIIKRQRREDYRRHTGHRQPQTKLQILSIKG
jgi:large subunit ribosomal protein L21